MKLKEKISEFHFEKISESYFNTFLTRFYDLIFEMSCFSVNFIFVLFVFLKALGLKIEFLIAYVGIIWEILSTL